MSSGRSHRCNNRQKKHIELNRPLCTASGLVRRMRVVMTGQVTQLHNILASKTDQAPLAKCSWKIWFGPSCRPMRMIFRFSCPMGSGQIVRNCQILLGILLLIEVSARGLASPAQADDEQRGQAVYGTAGCRCSETFVISMSATSLLVKQLSQPVCFCPQRRSMPNFMLIFRISSKNLSSSRSGLFPPQQ